MSTAATVDDLLAQASALRQQGHVHEAIEAYRAVLAVRPDLPDCWYNLAYLQRQARQFEEALASYEQALVRGVSRPEEVHLNRAVILSDHLARPDAAEAELKAALQLNPDHVPALLNLGNLEEDRGNRAGARDAYEKALAVQPGAKLALARLAGVTEVNGPGDPIILRLKQELSLPLPSTDRADLGYALGRAFDAVGAYDQAFAAFRDANEASRVAFGHPRYDRAAHERFVDRLIASVPCRAQVAPRSAFRAPIFICGMFRSGSTLVERILASHSEVTAGGELGLLSALIRAELQPYPEVMAQADTRLLTAVRDAYANAANTLHPDARQLTDKTPDNFLHIGLIEALFPDARIIHTRRNPLDNCLSIYFLQLDASVSYSFDLLDTAHWYRQQERLMVHWKSLYRHDIFEVDYDELVINPRPAVARLLDFCGLDWEESCLNFHEAGGVVKTASVWQVRQPLHRHSSGRWRRYDRHLGELRRALEIASW